MTCESGYGRPVGTQETNSILYPGQRRGSWDSPRLALGYDGSVPLGLLLACDNRISVAIDVIGTNNGKAVTFMVCPQRNLLDLKSPIATC